MFKSKITKSVNEYKKEHKYYKGVIGDVKVVGSEDKFTGAKIGKLEGKDEIQMALKMLIPNHIQNDDIVFLCIGTDRSTGDSLAPLVGTYLKGLGYQNVYGTIDEPTHALNIQQVAESLPKDKIVIAIDAMLGHVDNIGYTQVIKGSLRPGAGVGKDLGEYGDYAIASTVNAGGFMEHFVLQNTRLSLVMKVARDITSAIVERFPLEPKETKKQTIRFSSKVLVRSKGLNARLVTGVSR